MANLIHLNTIQIIHRTFSHVYFSLSLPASACVCVRVVCMELCTVESSSCRVDTAIIQKRLPVLHKYLNSDTERQLQALYALQALIVKLDQPPSEYKP